MSTITNEERRNAYLAAMGPRLGDQFHRLENECAQLQLKWNEYVSLFGAKPARIDLLNAAAPAFFGRLEDSLWDDVVLHVVRLIDQEMVSGKDTLTLRRLPRLVDSVIRPSVTALFEECVQKCKALKDWRDNCIAHRRLVVTPLAPASRATVEEALEAIQSVLNAVGPHYGIAPLTYEHTVSLPGDAEWLLYVLRDGVEAAEQRRERLASGQATDDDMKIREV